MSRHCEYEAVRIAKLNGTPFTNSVHVVACFFSDEAVSGEPLQPPLYLAA